jgi:hypothetical protein
MLFRPVRARSVPKNNWREGYEETHECDLAMQEWDAQPPHPNSLPRRGREKRSIAATAL